MTTRQTFLMNIKNMYILKKRYFSILCLYLPILWLSACGTTNQKPTQTIKEDLPEVSTKKTILSEIEQANLQSAKDFLTTKNFDNAKSLLLSLARKHKANHSVQANLALAFYELGEYQEAFKHAFIASSLAPKNPQIHNLKGLIAVKIQKFKDAEKHYQEALNIESKYALAHYNLAVLCDVYFQDIPRAYKHYNEYLTLVNQSDQDVKDWVEQLKYSIEQ